MQNWFKGSLVILLLTCLPGLYCFAQAKVPKKIAALKLEQTHFFYGETETIVSLQGLRINNRGRMHFSLVAAGPSWNVTIFRADVKTYISESFNDFLVNGLVSNFVVKRQDSASSVGSVIRRRKVDGFVVRELGSNRDVFAYLPLDNIAAPQVERLLYSIYRTPTNGGIPVTFTKKLSGRDWMTGLDSAGSMRVYISTRSIKAVQVPADFFQPPAGYRLSKSKQEVMMSKDSREASVDFDEIFDIGKNSRHKKF